MIMTMMEVIIVIIILVLLIILMLKMTKKYHMTTWYWCQDIRDMVEKRTKKIGQGSPPLFGQCPKKTFFFREVFPFTPHTTLGGWKNIAEHRETEAVSGKQYCYQYRTKNLANWISRKSDWGRIVIFWAAWVYVGWTAGPTVKHCSLPNLAQDWSGWLD